MESVRLFCFPVKLTISPLPITQLVKKLIETGMQPFEDFVPYPGRRLVIINDEKVETLPEELQVELKATFDLRKASGKGLEQMNEAIREELMVPKAEGESMGE